MCAGFMTSEDKKVNMKIMWEGSLPQRLLDLAIQGVFGVMCERL